jgi:hypothetical protein
MTAILGTPAYWASVREGDLVKLTKGDEIRQGYAQLGVIDKARLRDDASASPRQTEPLVVEPWELGVYQGRGWHLLIVERAREPLPTEPGFYLDSEGDAWLLTNRRDWLLLSTGQGLADEVNSAKPETFVPFRRLVPEESNA